MHYTLQTKYLYAHTHTHTHTHTLQTINSVPEDLNTPQAGRFFTTEQHEFGGGANPAPISLIFFSFSFFDFFTTEQHEFGEVAHPVPISLFSFRCCFLPPNSMSFWRRCQPCPYCSFFFPLVFLSFLPLNSVSVEMLPALSLFLELQFSVCFSIFLTTDQHEIGGGDRERD